MDNKETKRITWLTLAFMAFSIVWGFGNVINGFSEFGGLQAIVSWIIIFIIYFIPYALMVGELGSSFKELGGGVSSWILETIALKGILCRVDILGSSSSIHITKATGCYNSRKLGYFSV